MEKSKFAKYFPIVAVILILGLSVGLFFAIKKMQEFSDMFEQTKAQLDGSKFEYNQAKVLLEEKEFKINAIDKTLKDEIGKRKVFEEITLKWINNAKSGGTTTVINNYPISVTAQEALSKYPDQITRHAVYSFEDFRISITTSSKTKITEYKLTQEMGVKIYKLSDYDYRAEIIEYNRLTKEPVTTFTSAKFDIRKVYKSPDKFNFKPSVSIGGNIMLTQDLKFAPGGYLGFSFMNYGVSALDSKFRFGTLAVGTNGAYLIPLSYNLGRNLPLFNDLYIDLPIAGIQYRIPVKMIFGIGISSTL